MPTAESIVKLTNARLTAATVGAAGAIRSMHPTNATQLTATGDMTNISKFVADLATAGYAKNGGSSTTLSGTTPVTLDLINLATNSTTSGGDLVFASVKLLVVTIVGAAVAMAPGASNPFDWGIAGTTPSLTINANSTIVIQIAAGGTVDSTHKTILFTPTSGGTLLLGVGGA